MNKVRKLEMESWRQQCERQLKRTLAQRLDFGFVYTYKPVLDDASTRIFDTMAEYRNWSHQNLPRYLGYRRHAA